MKHKFLTGKNTKEGIKIMKNKTEQLKELFQKWYSEQEKSDFENSNHFSVDGLIKADDEDCVVLFVLAEPHSTEDHKYNPVFGFAVSGKIMMSYVKIAVEMPRQVLKNTKTG